MQQHSRESITGLSTFHGGSINSGNACHAVRQWYSTPTNLSSRWIYVQILVVNVAVGAELTLGMQNNNDSIIVDLLDVYNSTCPLSNPALRTMLPFRSAMSSAESAPPKRQEMRGRIPRAPPPTPLSVSVRSSIFSSYLLGLIHFFRPLFNNNEEVLLRISCILPRPG